MRRRATPRTSVSTVRPRWSAEEAAAEVIELAGTILDDLYGGREHRLTAMPYQEYLRSPEWKERRRGAYERAGYRCQLCNATGEIHAHHRAYTHRGREEETDDLIVLCRRCHGRVHEFIWKIE